MALALRRSARARRRRRRGRAVRDRELWRDLVALPGTSRRSRAATRSATMLARHLAQARPRDFRATEAPVEPTGSSSVAGVRDRGRPRARPPAADDGQAWTLLTDVRRAQGLRGARGRARPMGAEPRGQPRSSDVAGASSARGRGVRPHVAAGGVDRRRRPGRDRAGRAAAAARCADDRDRPPCPPGRSWRGRYKSLCLHDPVWYDHLPYLKFPENWPVFSPKDKIADWLEMYTRVMELNYWSPRVATQRPLRRGRRRWERDRRARR